MEKKTIGKFIAVMRKANGMTQKELGDKLFVSDKTVSRWERDECTPELSLIPAIAEIFGITTDELLRGEKNNTEVTHNEDAQPKPSAKSEKQFKAMLHSRMKKYKNLSLISVGLLPVGLIAATICNTVFNQGLLGFCIAALFIIASGICQILFVSNARLTFDEDTEAYTDAIRNANTVITRVAINIFYTIVFVFASCLPLTLVKPHFGLTLESWLELGGKCVLIAICIVLAVHFLIVRRILIKNNLIYVNESDRKYSRKLLLKVGTVCAIVMVILFIAGVVLATIGADRLAKRVVLESPNQFKAFMENQYDNWADEGYPEYVGHSADGYSYELPTNPPSNYKKKTTSLLDNDGNVLCVYYTNHELNYTIEYSEDSNDKCPITVITREAQWDAMILHNQLIELVYTLMIINVLACAAVYAFLVFRNKAKH